MPIKVANPHALLARTRRGAIALAIAGLTITGCASQHSQLTQSGYAVVGVDVIDVETGALRPDQTIFVRGDEIVSIASRTVARVPDGVRRIDGVGKTAIPGLWDMHTHVSYAGECALPTLVTYGVTGIRDMGAFNGIAEVAGWRSAIREGRLTGPDMRISSAPFESTKWLNAIERLSNRPWREVVGDRTPIGSVDDAIAAVQAAKSSGVDLIKTRDIFGDEGEILRALLAEAARQDILVSGHTPFGPWMSSDVFNPETRDRLGTAGRGFASLEHFDFLGMNQLDDAARTAVLTQVRDNGVMITATTLAIRSRLIDRAILERLANDDGTLEPDASPTLREMLRRELALPVQDIDWRPLLARADADARLAYSVGVTILAGTDFPAGGLIPGRSLHDELAVMVEDFGMSPIDALKTATINAARYWHEDARLGSIAPGKRADFLVLGGNPLADIRATRLVDGVMLRGEYLDSARLSRLRDDTRATMKAGGRCSAA